MAKGLGWALVGTGNIVKKFLIGLRVAEDVGNICVVSRSRERGEAFAKEQGVGRAYVDFADALKDPDVDVVYIGTPHPTHREYVLSALQAKKAVLCEKPVSIAAWETEEMLEAARANHTFFMEAMWTRFMPAMCKVREWIAEGQIGAVKMVQANFGFRAPWDPEGRLLNPALGGGSLLDAGIYPLSMASMAFGGRKAETVHGLLTMTETGVDEQFMGVISYGGGRLASLSSAVGANMQSDAWIYGDAGRIHMPDFVFGRSATLQQDGRFTQPYWPDVRGNGYTYEAEEVMRCVRAGKTESSIMPHEETLELMRTMDEIRKQNGFRYPFEK